MRHLNDIIFHQDPLMLENTTTLAEACERMQRAAVGTVLVIDDNRHLVGILTDGDARRLKQSGADGTRPIAEVMSTNPITLPPGKEPVEAQRLMWDLGIKHIPVVQGYAILGVLSVRDFNREESEQFQDERELWEHMR